MVNETSPELQQSATVWRQWSAMSDVIMRHEQLGVINRITYGIFWSHLNRTEYVHQSFNGGSYSLYSKTVKGTKCFCVRFFVIFSRVLIQHSCILLRFCNTPGNASCINIIMVNKFAISRLIHLTLKKDWRFNCPAYLVKQYLNCRLPKTMQIICHAQIAI